MQSEVHLLLHPLLLVSNHRARPAQSQPGDCLQRRKPIVFHNVCTDKAAGASQSRLTVHRNGTLSRLTDR